MYREPRFQPGSIVSLYGTVRDGKVLQVHRVQGGANYEVFRYEVAWRDGTTSVVHEPALRDLTEKFEKAKRHLAYLEKRLTLAAQISAWSSGPTPRRLAG